MVQKKLGLVQQHNAFTQLDDPTQAQRLSNRFALLDWSKILDRWARQVNPLLRDTLSGYPVYWVVDQAEYATDLLFKSRAALAGLYRSLLKYAVQTFTPKDILGFLGRKWDRGTVHRITASLSIWRGPPRESSCLSSFPSIAQELSRSLSCSI